MTARRVMIVVRDDGHGIAINDPDRISEPYFTTGKDLGTGLGLWVSKDLVAKNGGTIHVKSSTRRLDHGLESKDEPGCRLAKSA